MVYRTGAVGGVRPALGLIQAQLGPPLACLSAAGLPCGCSCRGCSALRSQGEDAPPAQTLPQRRREEVREEDREIERHAEGGEDQRKPSWVGVTRLSSRWHLRPDSFIQTGAQGPGDTQDFICLLRSLRVHLKKRRDLSHSPPGFQNHSYSTLFGVFHQSLDPVQVLTSAGRTLGRTQDEFRAAALQVRGGGVESAAAGRLPEDGEARRVRSLCPFVPICPRPPRSNSRQQLEDRLKSG